MNILITNEEKYNSLKRVWNYGASLVNDERIDGHLSITYLENNKEYTSAKFGITYNSYLEKEYGFKFVSTQENTDNSKYYF